MSAPTPPDPLDFSAGDARLGPYRLLRPISAGGMARVYEGRLDSLAGVTTRVAVKVIHPDFANEAAFQELFITEARISARLEHQNLVRIQQFNREGSLYYLVMEYIEGVTFRKIISLCRRHRLQLPVQVIAELGRQVCEGLHYAHNLATDSGELLHLVHRDIKPSNLMLNAHGVAKVLDFGISSAHGTPEAAGAVKGTWGYMALEQAEGGQVGPAADVFGLGAVLYELAALEPLFSEKDNAHIRARLLDDTGAARAAALGGAWSDLGGVLVRALQRDPDARHRNAAVFGRALSTLVVDPVGVHDSLTRLFKELRALEGAPPAQPQQEKQRSMPTMSRAGLGSPRIQPPPSLPVRFGDSHGVVPPTAAAAPNGRLPATLAAAGLLTVALAVLVFAAWQLMFGTPRRTVAAAPPVTIAAVPAAPPAPPAPVVVPKPVAAPVATVAAPAPVVTPAVSTTPVTTPAASTKRSTPTATTAASSSSSASPEPDAPVRIVPSSTASTSATPTTTTPATTTPAATTTTTPASTQATETRRAEGLLTISSMPRAQVMIDGQYVRYTPIFQHSVSAGSHTVLLVAEDGRRKSFKVDVVANGDTRRIWLFDEDRWSEP
ncbi:MAG: serine/threonine-protein kinase [Myxococcota bacterium]